MAEQKLSNEDIILNRQINFLIMRKMWQTIRGRTKRGLGNEQTIYFAFGMSRERFTRAIDGGSIRFSQKELERLMSKTGLRREIFEGQDCFQFEAITRKDWKKLFDLRNENIKKFREYEKYLYSSMKASDTDLIKNSDFYRFAVYLKKGEAETDISVEAGLEKGVQWMNGMGIKQLEKCSINILRTYLEALQRQADIVGTLIHYSELKQNN